MRAARILALALILAWPSTFVVGFLHGYIREDLAIERGASPLFATTLRRELIAEVGRWLNSRPQDLSDSLRRDLDDLRRGIKRRVPDPKDKENALVIIRTEFDAWVDAWKEKIERERNLVPPELQDIVIRSKQRAREGLAARVFRSQWDLFVPLLPFGAFLTCAGVVVLYVLRSGQVRQRLRLVVQVAMVGWTVFVALRLALGEWRPHLWAAEITRAIALWVAGFVPCLGILYWIRALQRRATERDQ